MGNPRTNSSNVDPKSKILANFLAVFSFLIFFGYQEVYGETFRMSKVVAEGTADSEKVELCHEGKSEFLFIEKKTIITGADVKSALRSPAEENTLWVTLTEEGGKKLGAATVDARGNMRIAVLNDSKIVSAPIV